MKKIVKVLFCLVAIVALASCGSNKLPEWADTEVLTENARVLIDTLNDFDYEGVAKIYNNPAVEATTFEASGKRMMGKNLSVLSRLQTMKAVN